LLSFYSSSSEALDEEQQTTLMAFVTTLAGTYQITCVVTEKTYFNVVHLAVKDDIRLLNLKLGKLFVLTLPPPHDSLLMIKIII
jgi:hypothetical protein